jgi:glycosyltransferase involved in cell wall biosynthesis
VRPLLPLVTIAIPTYNRADSYLPQSLASALAQTYSHLEIIVSDNCSTDDTKTYISSIVDPRLRYFRHDVNIGATPNFNFCLEQARGDYFLLLHDDDLIDADFLASCMVAAANTVEAAMIRTGARVVDGAGNVIRETVNNSDGSSAVSFFRTWFARKSCWYLVNTLFNTERLRAAGGFRSPYNLSEDGFAMARLACQPIINVAGIKATFRVHSGELTFGDEATLWGKEYLALLDCMCEGLSNEDMAVVRKEGRRFFASLAYNRVAAIRSPARRARAYYEIFQMYGYRYVPYNHMRSVRFARRAINFARRRGAALLSVDSRVS